VISLDADLQTDTDSSTDLLNARHVTQYSPFKALRPRQTADSRPVGGKSLMMDTIFSNTHNAPKRRYHFHEFMTEARDRIAASKSPSNRDEKQPGNAID
jgi:hypothetical protein